MRRFVVASSCHCGNGDILVDADKRERSENMNLGVKNSRCMVKVFQNQGTRHMMVCRICR